MLLHGNVRLGGVTLVLCLLKLRELRRGEGFVASEGTITAESTRPTVAEKPVMPDKLDLVVLVAGFDAVDADCIALGVLAC